MPGHDEREGKVGWQRGRASITQRLGVRPEKVVGWREAAPKSKEATLIRSQEPTEPDNGMVRSALMWRARLAYRGLPPSCDFPQSGRMANQAPRRSLPKRAGRCAESTGLVPRRLRAARGWGVHFTPVKLIVAQHTRECRIGLE